MRRLWPRKDSVVNMFFVLHKHWLDFCWQRFFFLVKPGPSSFIGHLVLLVWRFFGSRRKANTKKREFNHRVDVSVNPKHRNPNASNERKAKDSPRNQRQRNTKLGTNQNTVKDHREHTEVQARETHGRQTYKEEGLKYNRVDSWRECWRGWCDTDV